MIKFISMAIAMYSDKNLEFIDTMYTRIKMYQDMVNFKNAKLVAVDGSLYIKEGINLTYLIELD